MTAEADVHKGDFEKVGGECNGVSHCEEEGLVNGRDNGHEIGTGNEKEDADGSYVFVTGSDGVGGSDADPVEVDLSVGSVGKGSVDGVNGNCIFEGGLDEVSLEHKDPSSAAGDQNGIEVSAEKVQGSIVDAESEGLVVDASAADEQNLTVDSKDQEQGSFAAGESKELLDDTAVANTSTIGDQNGTVVSEEQEQGSIDAAAEIEGPLVDAAVTDNGAVSEELEQGSIAAAAAESKEIVDDVVASSSAAEEQNGTLIYEVQEEGSIVDAAESKEVVVEAAVVYEEQEQEGVVVVAAAECEKVVVDVEVAAGSLAEEENRAMGSMEQEQGGISTAAEPEEILIDAVVANSNVVGEHNGTVVSKEQVQGEIAAAESEEVLVDAGEENGLGSTEHIEGSRDATVAVVESEPAGDVIEVSAVAEPIEVDSCEDSKDNQVPKDLAFDVTYSGHGDCKAPIFVAAKLGNGEESNLDSVVPIQNGHTVVSEEPLVVDEKAKDGDENYLDSTEQVEGQESESIVNSSVESKRCELNRGDDTKENQECLVIVNVPVDLEQEKNYNRDMANKHLEMDLEHKSKAVSSDLAQTEIVNGIFTHDHPERECGSIPIVEVFSKPEGGLNSENEPAHIPSNANSGKLEEVNENSCQNTAGQPTIAVVSSDNVPVEANNVDVDIRDFKPADMELLEKNEKDVEGAQLAENETNDLAEDAEDGEAQLVETIDELVEEARAVDESKNGVAQVVETETSKDGVAQIVEDGVAQVVEAETNEDGVAQVVEAETNEDGVAQVVEAETNEDGVAQIVEAETNEDGVAQVTEAKTCEDGEPQVTEAENSKYGEEKLVEDTSELIEEAVQGSKNDAAQAAEVETSRKAVEAGDSSSKNGSKPDSEATDIQHPESNSKLETVESKESSGVSNGLAESGTSVNEMKVEAVELTTEVGEMGQPADADSESLCSGPPVEKKPFYFLIRIPRFDDEKVKEDIALAQQKVDEKTKARDVIMSEIQLERNICKDLRKTFHECLAEQRKLRDLHRSKRQEIDSHQSLISKARDAISMDDIDVKIRNMKHMIEHESLDLKEEKQYVREIEKLKQTRDDLSSNMGKQDEVRHALDQKDQVEKQLKLLRREADVLREELLKAQNVTTAAKKKLDDKILKLQQLQAAYNNADSCRQQEYSHLQSLWGPLNEKNKYFRKYKDDVKAAYNYALVDRQALQLHCINQVESFMELWNKNDEFRKDYLKCNLRSTLRRLGTHDGRSLGPDEEPPVIPKAMTNFSNKTFTVVSTPEEANHKEAVAVSPPLESDKSENSNNTVTVMKTIKQIKDVENDKFVGKNQTAKMKPVPVVTSAVFFSGKVKVEKVEEIREEVPEVVEDKIDREVEEMRKAEEAARLEEQHRLEQKAKAKEAARLEEQHRLEQKAKAKEALERKKRMAEKAKARAELRAKREQERKDEKMEKKKAAVVETINDGESSVRETPVKECEHQEKASTITKRSTKPLKFTKSKPIPPPLRNRGKRRMQSWMWFFLSAILVVALFVLGSSDLLTKLGLQNSSH